jgi:hypothetical protein
MRDDPHARASQQPLDHRDTGCEQIGIAAKLIDGEAAHPLTLTVVQERHRAEQRGKDAAAIDVAHEHTGGIGGGSHAHVHDVMRFEVDFRWGPGALNDNDVVGRG